MQLVVEWVIVILWHLNNCINAAGKKLENEKKFDHFSSLGAFSFHVTAP